MTGKEKENVLKVPRFNVEGIPLSESMNVMNVDRVGSCVSAFSSITADDLAMYENGRQRIAEKCKMEAAYFLLIQQELQKMLRVRSKKGTVSVMIKDRIKHLQDWMREVQSKHEEGDKLWKAYVIEIEYSGEARKQILSNKKNRSQIAAANTAVAAAQEVV